MNTKQAYEALNNANLHWGREDSTHIYVWTSGYKTFEHHNVMKFLLTAGMRMVREEFDSVCGKTKAVYKHKTTKKGS